MSELVQATEPQFELSVALFDQGHRLIEWNPGFASEFAAAGAMIVPGVGLSELLAAARRAGAPAMPEGRSFQYRDGAGRMIRVQTESTPSGALIRTARADIAAATDNAAFTTSDHRWCADGDPNAEATCTYDIKPDGNYEYGPYGEDVRALYGLAADFEMSTEWTLTRLVMSPEETERLQAVLSNLPRSLPAAGFNISVRDSSGRLRCIYHAFIPTLQPDGTLHVVVKMRDVTRERMAGDQLELLRSAITNVTDSIRIFHTSADGTTTTIYVNPAFERLTGWSALDVVGQSAEPRDAQDIANLKALQDLAERNDGSTLELERIHRNGVSYWAEVSATVVERREDGSRLWAIVSRNVDERRRAQAELLQAKEAAEAASRTKSAFLATMSHEIRTPLNGVLGMAQAMARDELSVVQRGRLEVVRQSGEALLTILSDLLDLSKIEAGKLELEQIEFDLAEVAEGAAAAFAAMAAAKGIELELSLGEAAGTYLGDPSRLRQILSNLVSNAVKFTDAGVVRIDARLGDGALSLTVSDTGPGIPPEAMERLFQKFVQADNSTTRRFGGTGLGLAICRELAQLMGGSVRAESRYGKGANFTLSLPLPRIGEARARAAPEAALARGRATLRILAAEDNPVNQKVLQTILEQIGLEVTLVADGAQAVEVFQTQLWDLILMDVQMPVMDGVEATRAIRQLEAPPAARAPRSRR